MLTTLLYSMWFTSTSGMMFTQILVFGTAQDSWPPPAWKHITYIVQKYFPCGKPNKKHHPQHHHKCVVYTILNWQGYYWVSHIIDTTYMYIYIYHSLRQPYGRVGWKPVDVPKTTWAYWVPKTYGWRNMKKYLDEHSTPKSCLCSCQTWVPLHPPLWRRMSNHDHSAMSSNNHPSLG